MQFTERIWITVLAVYLIYHILMANKLASERHRSAINRRAEYVVVRILSVEPAQRFRTTSGGF